MAAEAIERLEAALGEAAGTDVELERPSDSGARRLRHERGDAACRRAPPAAACDRGGARRAGDGAAAGRARRDRRPGFRQSLAGAGLVRGRARGDPRCRRVVRQRLRGGEGADPGRDGLGEPDRPDHGRLGPERRLRRLGRTAARVRRSRDRARVLLQRRRRADGPLPGVGGGTPARGGAAGGRLPGRLRRRAGEAARRPGARRC